MYLEYWTKCMQRSCQSATVPYAYVWDNRLIPLLSRCYSCFKKGEFYAWVVDTHKTRSLRGIQILYSQVIMQHYGNDRTYWGQNTRHHNGNKSVAEIIHQINQQWWNQEQLKINRQIPRVTKTLKVENLKMKIRNQPMAMPLLLSEFQLFFLTKYFSIAFGINEFIHIQCMFEIRFESEKRHQSITLSLLQLTWDCNSFGCTIALPTNYRHNGRHRGINFARRVHCCILSKWSSIQKDIGRAMALNVYNDVNTAAGYWFFLS